MPASLLSHANQIEDVQVLNEEYHADRVVYRALFTPKQNLCPCCSHNGTIFKGSKVRKLRMASLGSKMAFLGVQLHRLQCKLIERGLVWNLESLKAKVFD